MACLNLKVLHFTLSRERLHEETPHACRYLRKDDAAALSSLVGLTSLTAAVILPEVLLPHLLGMSHLTRLCMTTDYCQNESESLAAINVPLTLPPSLVHLK